MTFFLEITLFWDEKNLAPPYFSSTGPPFCMAITDNKYFVCIDNLPITDCFNWTSFFSLLVRVPLSFFFFFLLILICLLFEIIRLLWFVLKIVISCVQNN